MNDHLERAKEYLAIAESNDSKYEAYKAASEEIAAHKSETGDSNERIAIRLGKSESTIDKLLQWRKTGFEAATPFLMDGQATQRAALSHTKKVLAEQPETVGEMIRALPPETRDAVLAAATHGTHERIEENERQAIARHPFTGWQIVSEGLGEANRGAVNALNGLVKLAINAEVNPDDDLLRVAHMNAEKLGRSIYEIEMAWGEHPITDKIEELRGTSRV